MNEFDPKKFKKNLHGHIVLIENYEPEEPSGFFARFFHTPQYTNAFDSDLPVYRYATRDELYTKKMTEENKDDSPEDESSAEDQKDLQSPN